MEPNDSLFQSANSPHVLEDTSQPAVNAPRTAVRIPVALQVVAILMILDGAWAVLEILIKLTHGELFFDLSVLWIPCGIGLMRLRRGWRKFAIIVNVLVLLILMIGLVSMLKVTGPATFNVLDRPVGYLPRSALGVSFGIGGAFLAWTLWVLLRRRTAMLFALDEADRSRATKTRSGWALAIVVAIVGASGVGMAYLWHISTNYFVWVYAQQPTQLGPQFGPAIDWSRDAVWHSTKYNDADIVHRRIYDLSIAASHDGRQFAETKLELELAVQKDGYAVSYRMVNGEHSAGTEYAIRLTAEWARFSGNLEFALITPAFDGGRPNRVFWPDEDSTSSSTSWSGNANAYPTLNIDFDWIYGRNGVYRTDAFPVVREARAGSVQNVSAPAGMFPGSSQPIAWSATITPRDRMMPSQRTFIPAGQSDSADVELVEPKKRPANDAH